jgi:hypothetical protein
VFISVFADSAKDEGLNGWKFASGGKTANNYYNCPAELLVIRVVYFFKNDY